MRPLACHQIAANSASPTSRSDDFNAEDASARPSRFVGPALSPMALSAEVRRLGPVVYEAARVDS